MPSDGLCSDEATVPAIENVPPKHMKEFPISNMHIYMRYAGSKKLWTNGIVNAPILYPDIFIIVMPRFTGVSPFDVRNPTAFVTRFAPSPINSIASIIGVSSIFLADDSIEQGSVTFKTTNDRNLPCSLVHFPLALSVAPTIIISMNPRAFSSISTIYQYPLTIIILYDDYIINEILALLYKI